MSAAETIDPPVVPWRLLAMCRGMDPNLFFPDPGDELGIAMARSFCYSCNVRADCLRAARTRRERHGVWGGVYFEVKIRSRRVRCSRCDSTDLMRWNGRIECCECRFTWDG